MDWLLSGISALMLWQMGNKSIWGPRIGLAAQVLWLYFAIDSKNYGLVPGVAMFAVVHIRNLHKWSKP